MPNKNYLYFGSVALALVVVALFVINRGDRSDDAGLLLPTQTPVIGELQTATPTSNPSMTGKPTPALDFKVVNNFESLASRFDLDGNRRLIILNDSCSELLPSQVAYKNNTEIMIDNTRSSESHILKIGGREYSVGAGAWILTTLSSSVVPTTLTIFCGSMELGAIDLL